MKSLKSRLRRQDAPGPAPSGSGAVASAVRNLTRYMTYEDEAELEEIMFSSSPHCHCT